ncbi:MBL fold metallo-hydrolase [Actinomycetospora aeridis]|uniref:MBL fold metallo-hydrolase n=1 Tax=Actinomycetospora aeridis TaxID=3129231 RepID=A0ABU8MZP5_9PSEU
MTEPTPLGSLVEIDDRTVLVLGQELDIAHEQPDVGNALVHRAGEHLVLVDTGVTEAFRAALRTAVDRVGPWSRLLLITTHGHTDHVGNNDLVDELAAELGVPAEHWVSARDVEQMRDPVTYWERAFDRLTGVAPLPAPPALSAKKVVSLFQPLHPFGTTTRTYEERPLERLSLGSVRMTGWSFADGAVRVLRSQGHCAGHVIVHLRDAGLVHLGDEVNGPCGAMRDADQLKLTTVFGAVATAAAEGAVSAVTEGHDGTVRRGDEVVAHLDEILDQAVALQEAALEITDGHDTVDPAGFATDLGRRVAELGGGGPNPNPVFGGMMSVNMLDEIGLRPAHAGHEGRPWSRPGRTDPAPVAGMPHGIALLPAAAAMVGWKLRGRDK